MVQTASPRREARVAGESRCGRLIPWFWVRVPDGPSGSTPKGNRTPAYAVKGRRADRYTMGAGTR